MILAGTLSPLPNPENHNAIKLDERVDSVGTEIEDDQTIATINFSLEKQKLLRNEMAKDPSKKLIQEIVHQGWPVIIRDVSVDIRSY